MGWCLIRLDLARRSSTFDFRELWLTVGVDYQRIFIFVYDIDLFDLYVFAKMHPLSLGPLSEPIFLCISKLRVASGPRVKLVDSKCAFNDTVVYTTDHSKAMLPEDVVLTLCSFVINATRRLALRFVLFSVLLALQLTRMGKRLLVCVFHVFVSFPRDGVCIFSGTLDVRNWLRLVIVALPWLFFLSCLWLSTSNILKWNMLLYLLNGRIVFNCGEDPNVFDH